MAATVEEIQRWAQSQGLPICIGTMYAEEHGGNLPSGEGWRVEFCQWAHRTGRRSQDGQWACVPLAQSTAVDRRLLWAGVVVAILLVVGRR